jgi:hypothetical protein
MSGVLGWTEQQRKDAALDAFTIAIEGSLKNDFIEKAVRLVSEARPFRASASREARAKFNAVRKKVREVQKHNGH